MDIREVSVIELKQMQIEGKDFILCDVRGYDEYEFCNIEAVHIPMQEITDRYTELPRDKPVIIHCHHGGRSRKVINWLQDTHKFDNLYNLYGGIHAWSEEIDSNVPIY